MMFLYRRSGIACLALWCVLAYLLSGIITEGYAATPKLQGNLSCAPSSGAFSSAITPLAMYCVKNAIGIAVEIYYEGTKNYVMPIVYAMITLAMVMYGVRLMSAQVQDITKDSMTLLLKIGFILYFILSWRDYYPSFFGTIDDLNKIFVGLVAAKDTTGACDSVNLSPTLPNLTPFNDGTRDATVNAIVGAPSSYELWFKFDCLVGRLFGAGNVTKYAFSVSMVAVLGAALFSGAFGAMLFFVGTTAILSVFFVIMRSVLTVMMSYVSLAFGIILAPLFIPMILFKKTTTYFMKWMFLIVNSIIQPVFVMGFLAFALLIFNELLYEDSSLASNPNSGIVPLNKALGVSKNATVDQAWSTAGSVTQNYSQIKLATNVVTSDNKFREVTGNTQPRQASEKVANPKVDFQGSSGVDLTAFTNFFNINFQDEFTKFKALIMNMLAMLFLSYVTLKLLYVIPDMATAVTGNLAISLVSASKVPFKFDEKVAGFIQKAQGIALGGKMSAGKQVMEGMMTKSSGGVGNVEGAGWADAVKFAASKNSMMGGAIRGAIDGVKQGGKMGAVTGAAKGAMSGAAEKAKSKLTGGGAVGGAIRGGIEGMQKGGVVGGVTGVVKGSVKGAAGSVKDVVTKGGQGALEAGKDSVKGLLKGDK